MWTANGRVTVEMLPKPVGVQIVMLHTLDASPSYWSCKIWYFSLLDFGLGLVPFFLSMPPCPSLLEWEYLLCAIVYWKNVTFYFNSQVLTVRRMPRVSIETLHRLVSNIGTVKHFRTLGDRQRILHYEMF
jgi:hypothetical protein